MVRPTAVLGALLALCAPLQARDEPPPPNGVTVSLKDGTRLVGSVVEEDDTRLRVRTRSGLEVDVPRDTIAELRREGEHVLGLDPNYSRLLFAPTGRPLRKGDGYFSDYELVFPGVAVGVTDHLSIAGGVSIIPGLGLNNQLFYVSPRIGFELSDHAAVAAGALYATASGDDEDRAAVAVAFGVGTFGGRYRSLSLGAGLVDADPSDGIDPSLVLMIGGTVTLSRHIALVSENWVIVNDQFDLGEQPLGLGVRFFGDRLSADVGVIIVPEYVGSEGLLPWASMSFHFGPSGADRRQRRH